MIDEWFYTGVDLADGRLKITPFKPIRIFLVRGHRFGIRPVFSSSEGCWYYVATEYESGRKVGKQCVRLCDVEYNTWMELADVTPEKLDIVVDLAVQQSHRVIRAQQDMDAYMEADAREAQQFGELE